MKKKRIYLCIAVLLILTTLLAACAKGAEPVSGGGPALQESSAAAISFTDDDGREINLDAPCGRIISLYSAHTENLYVLGAGDKLIGAHSTSTYPPEAAFLDVYDYSGDPEKVIAANPDLVLIRPFITRRSPDFISALEKAGILVVSLYPESFDKFDDYINKLAMLTGTEQKAKQELAGLHDNIEAIAAQTRDIKDKQSVYFESTETNLRTITPDSMPAIAIAKAGGINVAKDAVPVEEGSSIASFGDERILSLAEEIDVYISQRGAMNAGGDEHSIAIRPGFSSIKAVAEGRVFLINEKIISSPTFRYYKGVKEVARYMYPEVMDSLEAYMKNDKATRRDFANIVVRSRHLPIYIPSSSKYYQEEHKGHTYGLFKDVPWTDEDFDYIESAALSGYVTWEKRSDGEYFNPAAPVTREELAHTIFIIGEFSSKDSSSKIADLAECENHRIVQTLVDNGVFSLKDGRFEPDREVTLQEIIYALAFVK